MKAQILYKAGDLRFEECELPKSAEDAVLVKVMAAGICGSDMPRIALHGAHRHPLIPGHEFAGQVVAVKDCEALGFLAGEQQAVWEKRRVGIFPLIPCMECDSCRAKAYEMCENYNYLGSRCDGGFAEYALVPVWNLIELPQEVSYEAAAMLEPMAVAIHAIRRRMPQWELTEEEKKQPILVWGLGTIGCLLVQFLQQMGYKQILAIGKKKKQRALMEQMGIPFGDAANPGILNWVLKETKGKGVSVFFEAVGTTEVLRQGLKVTAPGGQMVLVGNPASEMQLEKELYWKILRRQLTLYGTWNSSFTKESTDDWHYALDALRKMQVHPELLITHRGTLSELPKYIAIMKEKQEEFIKIMICDSESVR